MGHQLKITGVGFDVEFLCRDYGYSSTSLGSMTDL